jgi:hypothetical protein
MIVCIVNATIIFLSLTLIVKSIDNVFNKVYHPAAKRGEVTLVILIIVYFGSDTINNAHIGIGYSIGLRLIISENENLSLAKLKEHYSKDCRIVASMILQVGFLQIIYFTKIKQKLKVYSLRIRPLN